MTDKKVKKKLSHTAQIRSLRERLKLEEKLRANGWKNYHIARNKLNKIEMIFPKNYYRITYKSAGFRTEDPEVKIESEYCEILENFSPQLAIEEIISKLKWKDSFKLINIEKLGC
jgi:hypothetical protein